MSEVCACVCVCECAYARVRQFETVKGFVYVNEYVDKKVCVIMKM